MKKSVEFIYDPEADAGYFRFVDGAYGPEYDGAEEVKPGIVLDFLKNDQLVGIEILNVSKVAPALIPDSAAADTAAE